MVKERVTGLLGFVPPQHQFTVPAHLSADIGCSTGMIALEATTGDQGVNALRQRMPRNKLKLAYLVTREGGPGKVITFDPNSFAVPPTVACPSQKLEGRGGLGKGLPWRVRNQTESLFRANGFQRALG